MRLNQHVIDGFTKRTLQEFAQIAVEYLQQHPECDEVVMLADNIVELKKDPVSQPDVYYKLPEGYEYAFSGFYGQVIGIGRTGIKKLHRMMER